MPNAMIDAAIAAYRNEGGTLEALSGIVIAAWAAAAPPVNPNAWNEYGMTMPDEFGRIRIRELDQFRDEMKAAGRSDVAAQIRDYYVCRLGADLCTPGTKAHATAVSAISNAQFINGMGLAGGWRVFPATPTGNPLRPYDLDRTKALDSTYAVPGNVKGLSDVIEYVKREALAVAAGPTG